MRGRFIVIEGMDGAGTTTQTRQLGNFFNRPTEQGHFMPMELLMSMQHDRSRRAPGARTDDDGAHAQTGGFGSGVDGVGNAPPSVSVSRALRMRSFIVCRLSSASS